MGVPYLYRWLKNKNYKGVLRRSVPKYVSSLSLDANGIIHKCAQLVWAYGEHEDPNRKRLIATADPKILEAQFYNAISAKLQEILAQVRPREVFVIAIDGVAPQAKMAQQRQRRFRSAMERTEGGFDSSAITPGTDFMIRLDNYLQRWIASYETTLPGTVIYSSHMVPGEGEHKILSLMRSGDITGNGAHVLYGMDADLIMLSMLAPVDKISLMREDIRDVIDIDTFKYTISQLLGTPTAIPDYVVMTFTIGNDFLPHMPALEDLGRAIETLTQVYKDTGVPLTNTDGINWGGLSVYLAALAKEEPGLLHEEAKRDVKYPSRMLTAATTRKDKIGPGGKVRFNTTFDYSIFRGAWYENALAPKGWVPPGYNFGVSMNKVVHMATEYLKGMGWIYKYYTQGTAAINSDWVYRYHHTPLISDIAGVIHQIGKVGGFEKGPDQVQLNPIHQLLSVIPLKSKDLVPREVRHLMSRDSPIGDYYPLEVIIERDGKNMDWQGTVLIPFVEASRIINAVNTTTTFSYERAKLYSQANNIVIQREPEVVEMDREAQELRQMLAQANRRGRRGGRGRGRSGKGRDNRTRDDRGRGRGRGRGRNTRGRGRNTRGRGRGSKDSGREQSKPKWTGGTIL